MRLLADESVPAPIVARLRGAGHDVIHVLTVAPGTADPEVMVRAREVSRPLLTFDRDFGELIYRHQQPPAPGVILIRAAGLSLQETLVRITSVLGQDKDISRTFIVIQRNGVRQRPLPAEPR